MAVRRERSRLSEKSPGVRAKRARIDRGLTQREAAELVNVHPQTFSDWERGRLSITPHQLIALEAAYTRAPVTAEVPSENARPSQIGPSGAFDQLRAEFQEVHDWWRARGS